jgi:hypothetical protein
MPNVLSLRAIACTAALLLACSSSSDDGASAGSAAGGQGGASGTAASGSGGSGGTGGTGGSGEPDAGMSFTDGPAIDSAPAAWVRPADCGGIGELCEFLSCGEGATCQSIGNVCIPELAPGASSLPPKSAEHPYCAAFTCMSFDEASCFCTGLAAETQARCSSPEALAGLCGGQGTDCSESACCSGLSCVSDGYRGMVCEQTCASAGDCESGCCTDRRDTGDMICSPQDACDNPCLKRGDACEGSATSNGNCCRGTCIESENTDWAGCRPTCSENEDCDTGCCRLFTDSAFGFCTDATYCTCGGMGDACNSMTGPCCDGFECIGATVETLACAQVCSENTECSTGCCAGVQGADWKACQEPEYCGL